MHVLMLVASLNKAPWCQQRKIIVILRALLIQNKIWGNNNKFVSRGLMKQPSNPTHSNHDIMNVKVDKNKWYALYGKFLKSVEQTITHRIAKREHLIGLLEDVAKLFPSGSTLLYSNINVNSLLKVGINLLLLSQRYFGVHLGPSHYHTEDNIKAQKWSLDIGFGESLIV